MERILDAGRRTGSSKNQQRWAFIVVSGSRPPRASWPPSAPGPAISPGPRSRSPSSRRTRGDGRPLSVMWDLGRAAQSMVLAAWELGIGSVPATVYDHDRARELLGYPADWHCEFILSFGYPADPAVLTAPKRAGGRRALADLVHEERW